MSGLYFAAYPYHTAGMTPRNAPPEIFDRTLIRTRRRRAGMRASSFLVERCAADAADRVMDINRRFENALIIAPPEFIQAFAMALTPDKIPKTIIRSYFSDHTDGLDIIIDDEALPFASAQFDLVISVLSLHSINDPPGALIQLRQCLKPDGLFFGAMFGGETLAELRTALYAADETYSGGMSPRVYPFADYSQAAQLLNRAGFALPVVDTDRFTVNYSSLSRLIEDVRDLGDMNSLKGRNRTVLPPSYLSLLENAYAENAMTANGKLRASFEILWLTGWRPHKSQQVPLKPGSAKIRLADALGTEEKKISD